MTTPLIWVQFACSGHEFESKCTSMIFFSLTIIILFDLFKKKRFEGIFSKKKVFLMGNRTRVSPVVGQTARRRLRSQSIFLKRLRRSGLTTEELIKYYITYIRPVVEYACQAWHGSLTGGQCRQVEQIQKRSLRIIHPDMTYDDALASCKLVSLEDRRESLC